MKKFILLSLLSISAFASDLTITQEELNGKWLYKEMPQDGYIIFNSDNSYDEFFKSPKTGEFTKMSSAKYIIKDKKMYFVNPFGMEFEWKVIEKTKKSLKIEGPVTELNLVR